ncbi:hypothetical protein [Saccharothrix algeriensis]|uniref:Uncharacterized protein n=1 Tax=Saccharothrix algeriensis TaxID=173560 RepID=A0ABS2S212_9PSEU|nr:hypothetical protein [Saccharothrix algeriensis]MBM7809905.1 hypothetical protein [Saccharothrix algeriensis]
MIPDDVDVVGPLPFGRDDAEHDLAHGLLHQGFLPTTACSEVLTGRRNRSSGAGVPTRARSARAWCRAARAPARPA